MGPLADEKSDVKQNGEQTPARLFDDLVGDFRNTIKLGGVRSQARESAASL